MKKISEDIGVNDSVFCCWVRVYEHQGESGFIKSYTSYSAQYKMDVLKYMNEMGTFYRETAAIFNLSSPELIRTWYVRFEQGRMDALESKKKKGRPSMKKESKKPTPIEGSVEALQAKIERLEMMNAYLKKLNALV